MTALRYSRVFLSSLALLVLAGCSESPLQPTVDDTEAPMTALTLAGHDTVVVRPDVITPRVAGTRAVVGTLADAIAYAASSATLLVRPGEYVADGLTIPRSMTIKGLGGAEAEPIIRNVGAPSAFFVEGVTDGPVAFEHLAFSNEFVPPSGTINSYSIRARNGFRVVQVRSSTFDVALNAIGGIVVTGDGTSTQSLVVERSRFSGGSVGVSMNTVRSFTLTDNQFASLRSSAIAITGDSSGTVRRNTMHDCSVNCISISNAGFSSSIVIDANKATDCGLRCILVGSNSRVNVTNNYFSADSVNVSSSFVFNHQVVLFNSRASGSFTGNTVEGCGSGSCLGINIGSTGVLVQNNVFRAIYGQQTRNGIFVSDNLGGTGADPNAGGKATILDNTIIGVGQGNVSETTPGHYAIQSYGIAIDGWSVATVSRNRIIKTFAGLLANTSASVVGSGNVLVAQAVGIHMFGAGTNLQFHENDIIGSRIQGMSTGFGYSVANSLSDNWWGFPTGGFNPAVQALVGPIASRPFTRVFQNVHVAPGLADIRLRQNRVDVGSLIDGLELVGPGGTVYLGEGEYAADSIPVKRPLTLRPEAGASVTIRTTSPFGFVIGNTQAYANSMVEGTVAFRDLDFINSYSGPAPTTGTIASGFGSWHRLEISGGSFVAGNSATHLRLSWNVAPQPTVVIRGVSFKGGQGGLAQGLGELRIESSTFDSLQSAIAVHNTASLRIAGSSFAVCYAGCILAHGEDGVVQASIRDNTFTDCRSGCLDLRKATIDVRENTFNNSGAGSPSTSVIVAHQKSTGSIARNTIAGCGAGDCVTVGSGADLTVSANSISATTAASTKAAVFVITTSPSPDSLSRARVIGNTITGVGSALPTAAGAPGVYAFRTGVYASGGSQVVVSGNDIMGANTGIQALSRAAVTGVNNSLRVVSGPFNSAEEGTVMRLTRNDATEYEFAFNQNGSTASLRCNWWGSAAGPHDILRNTSGTAVYLPMAVAPIARTATGCP